MDDSRELAEAVRRACVEAALAAYEDAGLQGLCQEGRWERAVGAIRGLELEALLKAHGSGGGSGRGGTGPAARPAPSATEA